MKALSPLPFVIFSVVSWVSFLGATPIFEATKIVTLEANQDLERAILSEDRKALIRVSDGGIRDYSFTFTPEEGLEEMEPGLRANDMNEYGVVVGELDTSRGRVPVRVDNGTMTLLRCPTDLEGQGVAINDEGWILCLGEDLDGTAVSWLWMEGMPPEIIQSDSKFCHDIYALCMSQDGTVAGVAANARGDRQAFRYTERDGLELLGDIGPYGIVETITDTGCVVGYGKWSPQDRPQAFMCQYDMQLEFLMDFGGESSRIFCCSRDDTLVGYAVNGWGELRGACYTPEGDLTELLGPFGDEIHLFGLDINESGEIAGAVYSPSEALGPQDAWDSFSDRLRQMQSVLWLMDEVVPVGEQIADGLNIRGVVMAINCQRDLLVLGVADGEEQVAVWWLEVVEEE